MTELLLTGFEPFGGDAVNPSREVVRALDGTLIAGARVTGLELPCVFGEASRVLLGAAHSRPWALVLCLGLASNRSEFSVERVALNLDDARLPDNAGQQPVDRPVVAGGPTAHLATLPIKRMAAALRADGPPAAVSQTAGTYVCNHVFYALMHWASAQVAPPRAGFMHLPPLGIVPLGAQVQAVRTALQAAQVPGDDLHLPAGAIA